MEASYFHRILTLFFKFPLVRKTALFNTTLEDTCKTYMGFVIYISEVELQKTNFVA